MLIIAYYNCGKMTTWQSWRVIGKWKAGASHDTISHIMSIPLSIVYNSIKRHRDNQRDVAQFRSATENDSKKDRFLCRLPRGRRPPLESTAESGIHVISTWTVCRRLNTHRYKVRRPIKKPRLSDVHCQVFRLNSSAIIHIYSTEYIDDLSHK